MRIRIGPVGALFILLAGAAVLRFALPEARELFRDEASSWLLAQSPWGEIIPRSSNEPYPPLYAYALKAWIGILGDGEAVMRALSGLAGVAMVGVTWVWAREAIGVRAALLAAGLVALSPLAIANARDARMYALEALFATVAWWLIWRLLAGRGSSGRRPLVVLSGAAAVAGQLWTLPTGAAVFALQAGVVGVLALRRQPGTLAAGMALLTGFIAFVPWIPRLLAVATDGRPFWTPTPDLGSLLSTLAVTFGGWQPSPGWIAVLPLALLAGEGFRALIRDRSGTGLATALAVSAGSALVLAWWLASLWRSAYDTRYLAAAVPPLAIAISVGAISTAARLQHAGWSSRATRGAGAALFLLIAGGTATFEANWVSGNGIEPGRAASAVLAERVEQGDVILVGDALSYFPLAYLLERHSNPIQVSAPLRYWRSGSEPVFNGGNLIAADHTIGLDASLDPGDLDGLTQGGSIWLVAIADPEAEVRRFAPLWDGRVMEVERWELTDRDKHGLILRLRPNPG